MKTITAIILTFTLIGCMATTHRGAAIRDRISETPGLATHNISIDEERVGMITLNGSVSSEKDRDTIERVARNTNGVKDLRSNLVVDPSSVAVREGYPSSYSNSQRAIASEISSEISASQQLRDYRLNVEVDGSAVTLRGEVGNENERAAAERIARNTRGVSSVRNEINLARSTSSDLRISQDVREALRARTQIDLRDVDVSTRDAIVTLRGFQNSDRDIATLVSSARMVRGVRDVRNELTLNDRYYHSEYQQR